MEIVELSGGVAAVRQAVAQDRADVAVLACVDLPIDRLGSPTSEAKAQPGGTDMPLRVAAIPPREDPREALVSREDKAFTYLPQGAVFGVRHASQRAQLLRRRSDLVLQDAPEDLHERLRMLEQGRIQAFVAAATDLHRVGLVERIAERIDTRQMVPAAGQGALQLEVRATDTAITTRLAPLHDEPSAFAVQAERSCLARLGGDGGALAGIAVYAVTDGDEEMFIHGLVGTVDGREATRLRWQGPMREAHEVGTTLAELLLAAGADRLLPGAAPPPRLDVDPRW